jgi:hypothetical protein
MLESQKKGIEYLERLQGQECEYRLVNYMSNLSELTFQAYKAESPGHSYRITFQTTLYVQTVTDWDQGDFHLATPEKYRELADAMNLSANQREQLLLFTASPSNKPEVLVLCHQVFVSQEIPWP